MMIRKVAERLAEERAGKGSAGAWLDWAKNVIEPKIDPRSKLLILVRGAVDQVTGLGEYTYRRPNRRSSADSPLPASMAPVPRISVIIDTSGSMGDQDLGLALGIIGKVLKSLPNRDGVRVLCGDAELQTASKVFTPKTIDLKGGGGTDMGELIKQAAAEKPAPQLILVATDGITPWPAERLPMPVVACLTRAENQYYRVPDWIKRVHLN